MVWLSNFYPRPSSVSSKVSSDLQAARSTLQLNADVYLFPARSALHWMPACAVLMASSSLHRFQSTNLFLRLWKCLGFKTKQQFQAWRQKGQRKKPGAGLPSQAFNTYVRACWQHCHPPLPPPLLFLFLSAIKWLSVSTIPVGYLNVTATIGWYSNADPHPLPLPYTHIHRMPHLSWLKTTLRLAQSAFVHGWKSALLMQTRKGSPKEQTAPYVVSTVALSFLSLFLVQLYYPYNTFSFTICDFWGVAQSTVSDLQHPMPHTFDYFWIQTRSKNLITLSLQQTFFCQTLCSPSKDYGAQSESQVQRVLVPASIAPITYVPTISTTPTLLRHCTASNLFRASVSWHCVGTAAVLAYNPTHAFTFIYLDFPWFPFSSPPFCHSPFPFIPPLLCLLFLNFFFLFFG